ncbi:MAG: HTH domain-containing protein [Candidatus Gracilibacteria bacterium]|nr:HTH domain-containing protein [Candidatus Gracilibacteria bacterium]
MANFFNAAKKILKDYEYLSYKEIVEIGLKRGILHTDGKTPILTMSSRLGSDIRMKGNKSTFIRIGDGIFALRNPLKEDNLLVYLKYRLKDFPFWQIDDKDEKYLFDIFGRDIFADKKIELLELLKLINDKNKINDFNEVDGGIFVNLKKEENKNVSEKLKKKIEILKNDADIIKNLSININQNSGFNELTKNLNKVTNDLKEIVPQIMPNGLFDINDETFKQLDKLQETFSGMSHNPILENFGEIFNGLQETLKLYDISKLSKDKLEEFKKVQNQISAFNTFLVNPENFLATLGTTNTIFPVLLNDITDKTSKEEKNFIHTFEGYEQKGDFTTIRGYAYIQDLANISKVIYFDNGGVQRNEDKDRCLKIKKYIESGNKRFFPEVILGLYINDDSIKIENSIKGDKRKDLTGLSSEIKTVQIDFNSIKTSAKSKITRIDGNHRLFFANEIEKDFLVPFCFVIFNQRGENSDIQSIHKNQEANIFYLLNGKNEPVTSEEALQVLLNMPDEEAQSLYQNDSTLGLTRLCKEKYDKYLNASKEDTKRNFGDKVYTKFELLIKYIEKLGIENGKIDKLLDKVFSSINHLDEEYDKIISREDFLYLVLNVVLDNESKTSSKLNKLLKDFFDWILNEGLEKISSSEKPILWELFQKQKSFKETSDIHNYQINENKYNGKAQETAYKEFILLINESRQKIILKDIEEKRIGLEKIVDTYSKLLDIVGSGKPNNKQRVQSFIGQNFHCSGKPKLEAFLENYLYDVFGNNVMNNDFAIRHHETDKEKLEDKQFIEFLYCEYDNAIKFILDKAGFLI